MPALHFNKWNFVKPTHPDNTHSPQPSSYILASFSLMLCVMTQSIKAGRLTPAAQLWAVQPWRQRWVNWCLCIYKVSSGCLINTQTGYSHFVFVPFMWLVILELPSDNYHKSVSTICTPLQWWHAKTSAVLVFCYVLKVTRVKFVSAADCFLFVL